MAFARLSWIPKIGDEFASYRLDEMIRHGGMSIVYRARNLNLERSVALKLLAPELSVDPSALSVNHGWQRASITPM